MVTATVGEAGAEAACLGIPPLVPADPHWASVTDAAEGVVGWEEGETTCLESPPLDSPCP